MTISLTVKTLDSRNHEFSKLEDSMTVKELKSHIAPTVGIVAESQRLNYCGRVLQVWNSCQFVLGYIIICAIGYFVNVTLCSNDILCNSTLFLLLPHKITITKWS